MVVAKTGTAMTFKYWRVCCPCPQRRGCKIQRTGDTMASNKSYTVIILSVDYALLFYEQTCIILFDCREWLMPKYY